MATSGSLPEFSPDGAAAIAVAYSHELSFFFPLALSVMLPWL